MNTPFNTPGRRFTRRGPFPHPFDGYGQPVPPVHPGPYAGVGRDEQPDVEDGDPGFEPGFRPDAGPGDSGPRGRRGFGGPRFGPPGFGPGFAPGFGPRGFGPGRGGHPGRGGRGGPRGRRGNVRAAVLALLAEQPRHGYAIMTELAERSGGLWRPSPGSVYPVLQQLQDEGLVSLEESEGRRVFSLTEAGRSYVSEHPEELHEPWQVAESGPRRRVQSIMFAVQSLGVAADQVARLADDAQSEQAVAAIEQARRALYRILAGEQE
jgi:DNA-binding PadR family transcriptional regulator